MHVLVLIIAAFFIWRQIKNANRPRPQRLADAPVPDELKHWVPLLDRYMEGLPLLFDEMASDLGINPLKLWATGAFVANNPARVGMWMVRLEEYVTEGDRLLGIVEGLAQRFPSFFNSDAHRKLAAVQDRNDDCRRQIEGMQEALAMLPDHCPNHQPMTCKGA